MNLYNFFQNNDKLCKIFNINDNGKYCFHGQFSSINELPSELYNWNIICIYNTCFDHYIAFVGYDLDNITYNLNEEDYYNNNNTESNYLSNNTPINTIDHTNIENNISIKQLFEHAESHEIKCHIFYESQQLPQNNRIFKLSDIPANLLNKQIVSIKNLEDTGIKLIQISNKDINPNTEYIMIDTLLDITQDVIIKDINCNYNKWRNYGENQYISSIRYLKRSPLIQIRTH